MDFLQKVYFDNSIGDYLQVLISILLAFLLRKIFSRLATKALFKMGKGRWSGLSLPQLNKALIAPIENFFMLLVILIALDRLNFPKAFEFNIHHTSIRVILDSIARILVISGFASLLTHTMDYIALGIRQRSQTKTIGEHQLLFFFKDFIKAVIIIFAIVFIIKYAFYADVSKLLTGLSIIGAALALAAKESLENLIASFVIFFDKPFVTGDTVKIKDVSGAVEQIGLRSTRIRTFENSLVTIPNKQMVDNILDNFSSRDIARYEATINIPLKYPADVITQILKEMETRISAIPEVQEADVYLREFIGDNAIGAASYYTKLPQNMNESNNLRQKINITMKSVLDEFASGVVTL